MASLSDHLRHWFSPHISNNYRARLLHNGSLLVIIGIIIGTSALVRLVESSPLHILGFSSSVTIDEVVSATNRERLSAGLAPLTYSDTLADAARRKAANMFEENYWAHNSPSGKTPWVWFNQVGYKYTYAGENLAKDFGSTDRMMAAWMASPTHKANIVNGKYKEIGIAVVPGNLVGSDTVLVVQLFGTTSPTGGTVPPSSEKEASAVNISAVQGKSTSAAPPIVAPSPIPKQDSIVPQVMEVKATVDQFVVKKTVAISLAVLFLLALVVDLIIAENQSLSRRVGKNWGHIIVINVMLLLVVIAQAGSIL